MSHQGLGRWDSSCDQHTLSPSPPPLTTMRQRTVVSPVCWSQAPGYEVTPVAVSLAKVVTEVGGSRQAVVDRKVVGGVAAVVAQIPGLAWLLIGAVRNVSGVLHP